MPSTATDPAIGDGLGGAGVRTGSALCRRPGRGRAVAGGGGLGGDASGGDDHGRSPVLRVVGETAVPVAGPGAPLVAEFSVAEFATAVGLPSEVGKAYLGEAVELRYRLPGSYARVMDGQLPAWRARRIARAPCTCRRRLQPMWTVTWRRWRTGRAPR